MLLIIGKAVSASARHHSDMVRSAYTLLQNGVEWDGLSYKQKQRVLRDRFYRSAHSRPNTCFVQVDRHNRTAVKTYDVSLNTHRKRVEQVGEPAHFLYQATLKALSTGAISAEEHKKDLALNRKNGWHKHSEVNEGAVTKTSVASNHSSGVQKRKE